MSADTGGKESVEETEKQLADPEYIFDLGPKKLIKLTDFMNAVGTIKRKPTSWKEMFFPEVHDLRAIDCRPIAARRSRLRSSRAGARWRGHFLG